MACLLVLRFSSTIFPPACGTQSKQKHLKKLSVGLENERIGGKDNLRIKAIFSIYLHIVRLRIRQHLSEFSEIVMCHTNIQQ